MGVNASLIVIPDQCAMGLKLSSAKRAEVVTTDIGRGETDNPIVKVLITVKL